jgi:formate dehydrogenase maturation protein FdhE
LPPFAADSLVREDAWLPWLHGLLQGYQPAAQSAVEQAVRHCATPAPGSSRSGRWRWSAVSSLLPAALVPFLGAALQAAWSHWLLTTPDLPEARHQPQPVPGLRITGHGRGDSPSRQAQRPALSGVLAVRL